MSKDISKKGDDDNPLEQAPNKSDAESPLQDWAEDTLDWVQELEQPGMARLAEEDKHRFELAKHREKAEQENAEYENESYVSVKKQEEKLRIEQEIAETRKKHEDFFNSDGIGSHNESTLADDPVRRADPLTDVSNEQSFNNLAYLEQKGREDAEKKNIQGMAAFNAHVTEFVRVGMEAFAEAEEKGITEEAAIKVHLNAYMENFYLEKRIKLLQDAAKAQWAVAAKKYAEDKFTETEVSQAFQIAKLLGYDQQKAIRFVGDSLKKFEVEPHRKKAEEKKAELIGEFIKIKMDEIAVRERNPVKEASNMTSTAKIATTLAPPVPAFVAKDKFINPNKISNLRTEYNSDNTRTVTLAGTGVKLIRGTKTEKKTTVGFNPVTPVSKAATVAPAPTNPSPSGIKLALDAQKSQNDSQQSTPSTRPRR